MDDQGYCCSRKNMKENMKRKTDLFIKPLKKFTFQISLDLIVKETESDQVEQVKTYHCNEPLERFTFYRRPDLIVKELRLSKFNWPHGCQRPWRRIVIKEIRTAVFLKNFS